MKFEPFMKTLGKDSLKHVYLLAGEEHYYIEKAKAAILKWLLPTSEDLASGLIKVSADLDTDALIDMIKTVPFLVAKHIIVVQDSPLFREKKTSKPAKDSSKKKYSTDLKESRLLQLLADMPEYAYVIFICSGKNDKRRKAYKTVEKVGAILDADAVRPWEIGSFLKNKLAEIGKEFDKTAHEYFMGALSMMHEVSLSYLDKELEKLALYTKEKRIDKKILLEVFAGLPEVSSFAMLDAVSEKNVQKALTILQRQIKDGVYLPLLLALLVRHVRNLWQVKLLLMQGVRGKMLQDAMGLSPFAAEKLSRTSMKFSEPILKQAMLFLIDADYFLKTGKGGAEWLEYVVILLCKS